MIMQIKRTNKTWTREAIEENLVKIVKKLDRVPSAYEIRQEEECLYFAINRNGGYEHWKSIVIKYVLYTKEEEQQTLKEINNLMQMLGSNIMPTKDEIKEFNTSLYNRVLKYGGNLKGFMEKYEIGDNSKMVYRRIRELYDKGHTPQEIAKKLGCGSDKVYVYLRQLKEKRNKLKEIKSKKEPKKNKKIRINLNQTLEIKGSFDWSTQSNHKGTVVYINKKYFVLEIPVMLGKVRETINYTDILNKNIKICC